MPCRFPVHSRSAFDDQTLRRVNTARIRRRASQPVGVEGEGWGHFAKNVPLSHRQIDTSPKKLGVVT